MASVQEIEVEDLQELISVLRLELAQSCPAPWPANTPAGLDVLSICCPAFRHL
jgi:hypothetical protein